MSGVSRGTVDRVLNNRGKVKPETEAHVRQVAKQLGYRPNLAGKALAAIKKSYTIGVLLTSEGIPFFDELIRGVRAAQQEIAEYEMSVLLKPIKGYEELVQLAAIEEMEPHINALVFNPINSPVIASKMAQLTQRGIPVIAVNTAVEGSEPLCYIGPDYYHNGCTAGGMMSLLVPTGKRKIVAFGGSDHIWGHTQRLQGFVDAVAKRHPDWTIIKGGQTEDDDLLAYERAEKIFAEHPEVDGVYTVAAGTYGVCRAVMKQFSKSRPVLVCTDGILATREMIKNGVIDAAVCQQPYTQGYRAVRSAFDYLLSGQPGKDTITKSEILIAENL